MKKLKRFAALILALSLTVSLGAGASAEDDDYVKEMVKAAEEVAEKYISITPNASSSTNRGTYTLYLYDMAYLSKPTVEVTGYPQDDVTFTITNNHPTQSFVLYYYAYAKQPTGTKISYWNSDETELLTEDISGKYCSGDVEGEVYFLETSAAKDATSAGEGLYWNKADVDNLKYIEPGQSLTVSFDASLASNDVVYELFVEYYDSNYPVYITKKCYFIIEPETVGGFTDVAKSAYYADAVVWAVDNKVTDGVSANSFAPTKNVSRAEAVTFLWRAYGKPEPTTTTSTFKDVKDENAYYYKAVLWAAENGITTGAGDAWFDLNSKLTFEQILTFLCRAAGGDASGADWSDKAMSWAEDNGVCGTLDFSATDKCPRSDVVYCLYNQLGK